MLLKITKTIFNSSLFRATGIYTIMEGITRSIPFLLLPILTRYLSPADYGLVAMFGVLASFITPFIGVNTQGAIARQYYEQEEIDLRVYVGNCLFILVISSVFVSILFYLFAEPIAKISSFPVQLLWMVIVYSVAQFITQIVLTLWQVQVKPLKYGLYQMFQTILNAGLSLWFVVGLGLTWLGRIEAQLYSISLFALIGLFILLKSRSLKFSVNLQYIKNALNFGVPLIPHTLGGILIATTDRLFITRMVGLKYTGLYTVGYQIGGIIALLEDAFNKAYVPWLFERLKIGDEQVKRKIVKFTYGYFGIIFLSAIFLSLIAPWLLSFLVGKEFTGSTAFVVWVALAYAFDGMYKMVANYIFYAQKTGFLAQITFFVALLNVVLNYLLIKRNGAIGAAQATTIVFFLEFILTWILSHKVYKMPWNLSREKLKL